MRNACHVRVMPGRHGGRPGALADAGWCSPSPARDPAARTQYVQTLSDWVYTTFVMDLFSHRILGWQVADHLRRNEDLGGLVHHSDSGMGSKGD
jgi:putative transposase